jgi:hypothetical protein
MLSIEHAQDAGEWIQRNQLVGALLFVPVEIIWVFLCVPTTPLELAAGFSFGTGWGFVVDSVGKLLGGALSFLVGRHCLKDVVGSMCLGKGGGGSLMRSVDHMLATEQGGGYQSLQLLVLVQLACTSWNQGGPQPLRVCASCCPFAHPFLFTNSHPTAFLQTYRWR